MSFDQGAWDRITALSNEQYQQQKLLSNYDPEDQERRIEALERRLAALEQHFKNLKKAVWHS